MQEDLRRHRRKTQRRMVRKQVLITAEQNERLKATAHRLGLAEADLVRSGIDAVLADKDKQAADWKQAFETVMSQLGDNSELAQRVEANKIAQAAAWKKRLARNRKQLDGR